MMPRNGEFDLSMGRAPRPWRGPTREGKWRLGEFVGEKHSA